MRAVSDAQRPLSSVAPPPRSGEHIGLYNTSKRIALVYGEGYGIRIDSKEGKGTRVEIRIPSGWPVRGEVPQQL